MSELRVLVVDDDFRVADIHAAAVASIPGYTVVGRASSLAEAKQLLGEQGIDLIVADEYLPDGSGSDLIGFADASVIMVTAAVSADVVERALIRGAVGYVVKPFNISVLVERLRAYQWFRENLSGANYSQEAIDAAVVRLNLAPAATQVPKGRSAVTNKAIVALLKDKGDPMTAIDVAEEIGVSRATAHRYLSDLVATGQVKLSLHYGAGGRPEHVYQWDVNQPSIRAGRR